MNLCTELLHIIVIKFREISKTFFLKMTRAFSEKNKVAVLLSATCRRVATRNLKMHLSQVSTANT